MSAPPVSWAQRRRCARSPRPKPRQSSRSGTHCNTSSCPFVAVQMHVYESHGQPCSRAHCNTVPALSGQWRRRPAPRATVLPRPLQHAQPFRRSSGGSPHRRGSASAATRTWVSCQTRLKRCGRRTATSATYTGRAHHPAWRSLDVQGDIAQTSSSVIDEPFTCKRAGARGALSRVREGRTCEALACMPTTVTACLFVGS